MLGVREMKKYEVFNAYSLREVSGVAEQIREYFEESLERKLGFFVMLQESEDDGELVIYLHTDNQQDLNHDQLEELYELGLVYENDHATYERLLEMLKVSVYEVE